MQALLDHHWQGNVRELNHVIERAVLMAQEHLLRVQDLALRSRVEGAAEPFLVFGGVLLALGIGFLISAGTAYALSKSLGALPAASHR